MALFYIVIFFLVVGAGLGYMVMTTSGMAVTMGNLTGIEGFIVNNLMLIFILVFVVAIIWYTR